MKDQFESNFRFLRETDPSLHRRLSACRPVLEPSRSGPPTLKVDGVYIESRYDPERGAAEAAFEALQRPGIAVFLGSGLGYRMNALFAEGLPRAVVIEKDPVVFRAALHVIEPRFLPRILPLVGESTRAIERKAGALLSGGFTVVRHAGSMRLDRAYYRSIESILGKLAKERNASRRTEAGMQRLWEKNFARNLRRGANRYLTTGALIGAFAGPVLLAASGPFLEQSLQGMKMLRDVMPFMALLPSLSYLLAHGVLPDLLFTTDAGFGNLYRFVRGIDTPLVSTFSAYPPVLENWSGKVLLFSHRLPFEERCDPVRENSIGIPMQGTSSAVMILFARVLGFSPIYLAGFDFAYLGIRDHHAGAGFENVHLSVSDRCHPWHTRVFRGFRGDVPMAAKTSSGASVYSTYKLMLYRNWLDREVAGSDLFRINDGIEMENVTTIPADRQPCMDGTGSGYGTSRSPARTRFLQSLEEVTGGCAPVCLAPRDGARAVRRTDTAP